MTLAAYESLFFPLNISVAVLFQSLHAEHQIRPRGRYFAQMWKKSQRPLYVIIL